MPIKARPILMSTPMAIALRTGSKTQTRRLIKPRKGEELDPEGIYTYHPGDHDLARCPYGKPGDLLWVRETYGIDLDGNPYYRAGDTEDCGDDLDNPWKPSIFMPRRFSCLTLEITNVRVEQVQDISDEDCEAEGVQCCITEGRFNCVGDKYIMPYRNKYRLLWDSINGPGSWAANGWVWVLEFKVHKCNIDAMGTQ